MAGFPRQGEVWWATFQEGWERPAVIVSRDELNHGRLVLVVPCTSSRVEERVQYPNHVLLRSGSGGLTGDTAVQAHLIQPIEAALLTRRLGRLRGDELADVLLALAWVVDFFDTARRERP